MIQVRCPRCGTLNQVAADGGAIRICCYACKFVFPATGPGGTTSTAGSAAVGGMGLDGYPPGGQVTGPAVPAPAGGPIPPHLAGNQGHAAAAPQAVAAGIGGGPQDAAVVDRETAVPSQEGTGGLLMVLVVAAAVFVLLGSALLLTLLAAGGRFPSADETGDEVTNERVAAHWSDAASKTLEIDGVRVRIDRAEWDQVRGRDRHSKIITTGEKYLSIIVNIESRSRAPNLYESWHSGPYPAVLMDEDNRVFEPFRVSRFRSIEWHVAEETLERLQEVDDRLVFILPADLNRDLIGAFRLELPAQAVGREGVYRFRIPAEMVEGF